MMTFKTVALCEMRQVEREPHTQSRSPDGAGEGRNVTCLLSIACCSLPARPRTLLRAPAFRGGRSLPRGRGWPRWLWSERDVVEMLFWGKEEKKTSFWRKRNLDVNGTILSQATRWGTVSQVLRAPHGPPGSMWAERQSLAGRGGGGPLAGPLLPSPHPACRGRGQRRVNGCLPQAGGHWEAGSWQLFRR